MNSPAHFVIGAAICRQTRSKPLGFVLALASHFALDALPHLESYGLFPQPLRSLVASYWSALLLAAQLLLVPLVALAAWRLCKLGHAWPAVLYVVAGGLFACVPDALSELVGSGTVIGRLNESSHILWHEGLQLALLADPRWRPALLAIMVLTEAAVFAAGLWLVLRRDARRED
ncbi:MAG: hypothetical protein WCP21_08745 [Armatimonadota bacterium]